MKNTNAARKAAEQNTPLTNVISITLPGEVIGTYKKYCENFLIPLEALLQGELISNAEALRDCIFGNLERMDRAEQPSEAGTVHLRFTNDSYAVLSRLAHLLRRSLPDFAQGVLSIGANLMEYDFCEAAKAGGVEKCKDLPEAGRAAIRFNLLERKNQPVSSVNDEELHVFFGIQKPVTFNHSAEVAA